MTFLLKYRRWIIVAWSVTTVVIGALLVLRYIETNDGADGGGFYQRVTHDNNRVIIFVHGVLGNGTTTWTNPDSKAYWPDLLTKDPIFNGYNIFVYEFPSPLVGRSYSIDGLADNMRAVFKNGDVLDHKELIFIAHSMGGLATRAFLLKYRDVMDKTTFIYFFSTPTTGSDVASVAALLSENPQFRNMFPMDDDNTYIESQQSSWLASGTRVRSYCAVEVLRTNGLSVVTRQSATNLCTNTPDPIRADHISIVKPADQASGPYIAFRNAFRDMHPALEAGAH